MEKAAKVNCYINKTKSHTHTKNIYTRQCLILFFLQVKEKQTNTIHFLVDTRSEERHRVTESSLRVLIKNMHKNSEEL